MEGREWVSLGGVGHVELSEGFFGLTVLVFRWVIAVNSKQRGRALSNLNMEGSKMCYLFSP